MWIARTSEYTWILNRDASFWRTDCIGVHVRFQNPCTCPQREDEVVLLNGVDDYGKEVVCYLRAPNGISDIWSCRYEIYGIERGYWTTVSPDMFYRYSNLKHILDTNKRVAEEILLGQT